MNKYSQKGSTYAQFAFGDSTSRKLNDEMFSNTTNKIKTTRYTWYSWFPKSLIWQFRRVDNYYFLLITFLTFMPFSSKSSIKQLVTFLCVLFITMIKEGAEDLIRYKQDCETNSKSCLNLYKDGSAITEKTVKWEDIQVGDVIKIIKNQEIPADVLLISSSHKNNNVYVDTKNIDGEVFQ
jgi:magnesium-transporting ATPase (P-type)